MPLTRLPLTSSAITGTLPIANGGTNVTSAADLANTGNLVKISSATANNDSSISFTSGIDSTYDKYIFECISIRPATDNTSFQWNASIDGGSNYNVSKTSTFTAVQNRENDTDGSLFFSGGASLGSSTNYHVLSYAGVGNRTTESCSVILELYNPSSTSFEKLCHSNFVNNHSAGGSTGYSTRGEASYVYHTTSAINAVDFEFASGNITSGTIILYGVKT